VIRAIDKYEPSQEEGKVTMTNTIMQRLNDLKEVADRLAALLQRGAPLPVFAVCRMAIETDRAVVELEHLAGILAAVAESVPEKK
jgi:hypothetical protein